MSQKQDNPATCQVEGCERPAQTRGRCRTHYQALWRSENLERRQENERQYREKNRERLSEYHRQRYQANREKILAKMREHQKSPEYRRKKAEAARKWAKENPERARETARRGWAKRKYGLTLEEYDAILARGCAICGTKEGTVVGKRGNLGDQIEPRLCIDHDHTSGKVRAALCHSCNTGLGSFGDDPARLRAAADYIESHR